MLFSDICSNIKLSSTHKLHLQTKNRRCIPLEFRCILHLIYLTQFHSFIQTISIAPLQVHFYSEAIQACTYERIDRINQKEVSKPNNDCMTEVNQAMNDFISPIQYVDLKSKEECFTTVFFFAFPTALSEPLCRPSHDIYGFGSQQFNGISLTETNNNNMPSRFFISNRFLLGDF